jgi:myo-inositol 2-dehydrogenase/D-chiro-inositol 1-dehydrogenase
VLAEKPATLTVADLEELQRVMRRCSAQFRQMGSTGREAILAAIRKVVDSGKLGQVVQAVAQKSYPYQDWRPQDRGKDGGIIRQAGIHGVRYIQWATGLKAVRACGFDTGRGNPKTGRLQMAASVAFELESGALGVLICNYCNPKGTGCWGNEMLHIHGTGGLIEVSEGFQRARMVIGSNIAEPIPEIPSSYPDFFDSYVEYLLDGTPMPYSLEDDLYALRTVNIAQEAVDKGCILEV